jgi:3-oxoadipate enol-lactonase
MAQQLAESIPDATLLVLAELRHLSLIERPSLAGLIRAHLHDQPVTTG